MHSCGLLLLPGMGGTVVLGNRTLYIYTLFVQVGQKFNKKSKNTKQKKITQQKWKINANCEKGTS